MTGLPGEPWVRGSIEMVIPNISKKPFTLHHDRCAYLHSYPFIRPARIKRWCGFRRVPCHHSCGPFRRFFEIFDPSVYVLEQPGLAADLY